MKEVKGLKASKAKFRDILPSYFGKHIRIAFSHGNGFVHCRKADGDTWSYILKDQEDIRNRVEDRKRLHTEQLAGYKNMGIKGYVAMCTKKSGRYFRGDEGFYRDKYIKKLKHLKASLERCDRILSKRNYILDAKVVTVYPSIDPLCPDTYIIVLDGEVNGEYWSESEYLGIMEEKLPPLNEMGAHRLAAAVVKQAASDDDKSFFLGDDFDIFMPQYDGEAVWKQIRQNYHESMGSRWYANKNEDLDL